MIDIHSHIIFEVDDGARSLEDSLQIAREALDNGITSVIATPHFAYQGGTKKKVIENFSILKAETDRMGLDLLLGSELMATPMIQDALDTCIQIESNGHKYQLVEFPNNAFHLYLNDMIYKMQLNKITPIIAHPERNTYFQRNYTILCEMSDKGCLFQLDAESFRRDNIFARKLAKKLIKDRRADFVSFDVHSPGEYARFKDAAVKTLTKWTDQAYIDRLFTENAKKLVASV